MDNKERVEMNDEQLEQASGGEYGDLLKPIVVYWKAKCSCGYQLTVTDKNMEQVVCPVCNRVITKDAQQNL